MRYHLLILLLLLPIAYGIGISAPTSATFTLKHGQSNSSYFYLFGNGSYEVLVYGNGSSMIDLCGYEWWPRLGLTHLNLTEGKPVRLDYRIVASEKIGNYEAFIQVKECGSNVAVGIERRILISVRHNYWHWLIRIVVFIILLLLCYICWKTRGRKRCLLVFM